MVSNTVADVYARCTDDPAARGREAQVYDAIHAMISPCDAVLRFLPHKARRMVGAWCSVSTKLETVQWTCSAPPTSTTKPVWRSLPIRIWGCRP